MFRYINTKKAPAAVGPYSQAIKINGILYASGQLGLDPASGNFLSNDIEVQAKTACENVGEILKEAGMSFENVVKTTCFLADMKDFAKFNEIYEEYFISKPARSCVAAKSLPKGGVCEIEIIAVEK